MLTRPAGRVFPGEKPSKVLLRPNTLHYITNLKSSFGLQASRDLIPLFSSISQLDLVMKMCLTQPFEDIFKV